MKDSLLLDVFIHAGFFLAIAALIIPLFNRFKIPSVLGYLGMGIFFGPQGLGSLSGQFPILENITFQNTETIQLLSELGIVFLLFVIGLELTPKKLWQMRFLIFGLGTAQVTLTALVIGLIAYFWGNSVQTSILLGLGLSLSSTAIITKWLHEKKLFNTGAGQTSFSILLLQDLAVIPILLLITIFSSTAGEQMESYIFVLLIKMTVAVIAIVVLGKWCVEPVFKFSNKHGGSEVFIALSFLVIILSATIAGVAGLSLALGAFIGGLLLAETQYSREISALIVPFKSILLGIFFMAFGMSIDIDYILLKPLWLILSVIGLMSIKAAIIYILCRLWRIPKADAAQTAVLLPQAGEFGLLVVGSALTFGFLAQDVGQFMFLTIGLTMMLTPFLTPLSSRIGKFLRVEKETPLKIKLDSPPQDLKNHVIIIGYGRMGKTVSEILAREGVANISYDNNADHVIEAQKNNSPVYFGDMTKKKILQQLPLSNASSVVITIDKPSIIEKIYKNIREIDKNIPLIIRTHKRGDLINLQGQEGVTIVPEYLSTSLLVAEKALEYAGYQEDEAHSIAQQNE